LFETDTLQTIPCAAAGHCLGKVREPSKPPRGVSLAAISSYPFFPIHHHDCLKKEGKEKANSNSMTIVIFLGEMCISTVGEDVYS